MRILIFQSTLPRGERQYFSCHFTAYTRYFNPRSHEGSDSPLKSLQHRATISIHAPTRGATISGCDRCNKLQYFNPRSHEGSDRKTKIIADNPVISIHAPTRGATLNGRITVLLSQISIHAPTRGATYSQGVQFDRDLISIHAPTRGATL